MHQLITLVVTADGNDHARQIAEATFEHNGGLDQHFDYGKTMSEDARWSDQMADVVQETGAIEANTETGLDLINRSWESTIEALNRNLAAVRTAFEQGASNKEVLERLEVETEVDKWNPLGLAQEEDDLSETYTSDVRYAMHTIGSYGGPDYHLYHGDYAEAIRRPSAYEQLIEDIKADASYPDEKLTYFAIPMDVHY